MGSEMKLPELKEGDAATIVRIDTTDDKILKKLMALGVLPGMNVVLFQKFPSYVLKVGNTRIAADEAIAKSIVVVKK
ncbi:ferrous iron transport protein A [Caldanaerovirga acetigignens]|uniref:Ferrous iron transport protein A n=1 Tax=Caldanaerovirga acetigignens TaxID=447595 RepID=A0A1M7LJJ0_9FIRM|nr:FeoA family protein [Caldanaerovirga acetigignens]SHM78290.1 ferrous iron transport protein A [Caldanaerovirga acetigignens]